jgi:hypothetical protein
MYAETETIFLSQTITHPQPPLKRGVSAIAHWGEGFEWDFSTNGRNDGEEKIIIHNS